MMPMIRVRDRFLAGFPIPTSLATRARIFRFGLIQDHVADVPSHEVYIIGPMVELLARPGLHPALCDLLIEAAQEARRAASLLKRKGEFPTPLVHAYPAGLICRPVPWTSRRYRLGTRPIDACRMTFRIRAWTCRLAWLSPSELWRRPPERLFQPE